MSLLEKKNCKANKAIVYIDFSGVASCYPSIFFILFSTNNNK